jgi:hypothetical protein
MAKKKSKRNPKTVLKLPDLEQSKSAVVKSLTSRNSHRAIMPSANSSTGTARKPVSLKTVVTRYRISLEDRARNDRSPIKSSLSALTAWAFM